MKTQGPLAALDHSGTSKGMASSDEDAADDANLGIVTCPECGCEFDPETGQAEDTTTENAEEEASSSEPSSSSDEGSAGPPEKKMPKSFFALMGYGRKK